MAVIEQAAVRQPWLNHYPAQVPQRIAVDVLPSLTALLDESFRKFRASDAYIFMGRRITFAQVDEASRAFAAWLQAQGLQRGDRVAVMLPNLPQYPIAVAGILRCGMVVVNVNPLYQPRELEHQLKDSGAKAIVIYENFAATLQQVLAAVPLKHVVLAATGDLLGRLKGHLVNAVVRHVKQLVPPYHLEGAMRFRQVLQDGRRLRHAPVLVGPDDIAVLQYTGGTTGVSKGAVLLHRNLVANVLQSEAWNTPALQALAPGEQTVTACVLPIYHIFGFTTNMMTSIRLGGCSILIPNARDVTAMLKELSRHKFHCFHAVNTLFNAVAHHRDFDRVSWKNLSLCVGGGMPIQQATAKLWLEKTGCTICEGYGLSEASPSVTCNPVIGPPNIGSIGMPMPNTDVMLLDDAGQAVAMGERGELAVKGPQVMAGYWQRPEETAKVMTAEGYLRTGDIATMDERGYFKLVDRKKDMILVSGFNVYPNEIEDVLMQLGGVLECAAIGVPDAKTGEAVKVLIVRRSPALTEADIRAYCEANLTGYKRPKIIEFRVDLPKSAVGKILRRELRDRKA